MSTDEHQHEAETEAAEESGPSALERFQNLSDADLATALDGATKSSSDRQAAAELEPAEQTPAVAGPGVNVAEVWARELEEDVELLDRAEELSLIASAYMQPELQNIRTEQDAVDVLGMARVHLEQADREAQLGEVVAREALATFEQELLAADDDDMQVVAALDRLIDSVPEDDPRLVEMLELAESLAPTATLTFVSMLQAGQQAQRQEDLQAELEAVEEHAAEVTEAVEAELADHEKTLRDPRVAQITRILFSDVQPAADPAEVREQVRTVVHAAKEVDSVDRRNQFLAEFDQAALGRIASDAAREQALAAAGESWATPELREQPSREERIDSFLRAFDERTAHGRDQ